MYSSEDIKQANDTSIISYLERNGYSLKQKGRNTICLAEHDSLIITPSENKWYWFSKRIGGVGCLDFVKKYEGLDFKSAMDKILGNGSQYSSFNKPNNKVIKKEDEFTLPTKVDDTSNVYNYLCNVRKIKKSVVDKLIAENKLYQDDRTNCVFVGYDIADIPRYALRIGTNPDNKFKGEVKGSNKAFAPEILSSVPTDTVCVFESIIDTMSVLTLYNLNYDLISLSGVSGRKLEQYLNDNKSIKQIIFMLDNDEVGRSTMKELMCKYAEIGYDTSFELSKEKDWNEELVAKNKRASILEKIKESTESIGKTNKRYTAFESIEL